MFDIKEAETWLVANHWMVLWGECRRARFTAGGTLYVRGAPSAHEFRPADDPDPMCFVVLQVEHSLGNPAGPVALLAHHVWVKREPVERFTHPDLSGRSRTHLFALRRRVLSRLATQILARSPEVVTPEAVSAARARLLQERKRTAETCSEQRCPGAAKRPASPPPDTAVF